MAGVQVGLKDLHFAIMKDDETYETPEKIAGAITAKISPSSNTETLYADDGPSETVTSLGEIKVEFEVKDIPLDIQAKLLGHTVNSDGVLIKQASDTAPYVAIGFKSKKSNGKYRYVWLYKGKFELPEQEYKTMEDKPAFQTPKVSGTFVKRDKDGLWQAIADEDSPNFTSEKAASWFTSVYEPPVA
ncbi:major tail protein [Thermaerobacillus caldiproteolyticus]|jgi:phi13 family phage major tail protein|uniref:major tail protein n=1 Tax=Thermaerobacillus caldiproteolyticus TaxID=247480 RepID=UPI00188AE9C3|nr:major tail protein [Anoxybacillus caldiproteolyticus]QPA31627.1 phage tail protein [Anoxybacillus caldiproteolyticus]